MTIARASIEHYGAPIGGFLDILPVEDPTCEQSATYANRQLDDTVQMTRTTDRAIVRFLTTATAAPIAVTPTDGRSHYGTGPSQIPIIGKIATGRYTITYPVGFLDLFNDTETVLFWNPRGFVENLTTAGHVQCTAASNVINVAVFDMAGALSDLGGGVQVAIVAK